MISLIAAIGKNRELGKNNGLVFHLKEDMRFFKKTTLEHKVVMGRKTWESLPKKLSGRKNMVASRRLSADFGTFGVNSGASLIAEDEEEKPDEIIANFEEFLRKNQYSDEEIFVIGGASIYEEALPFAKKLILTEIDAGAEADVYFPEFNKSRYARRVLGEGEEKGIKFQFVEYKLKSVENPEKSAKEGEME